MDADDFDVAVIIPANNEEEYIERCLASLFEQDETAGSLQIIVAANACTDRTESIVMAMIPEAKARGWKLTCLSSSEPGKLEALNRADKIVRARTRIYLDADVTCELTLIGQIRMALDRPGPAYATGKLNVAPARSWFTRRYAEVWVRLPFVQGGAVGAGLFGVNDAGRERWSDFPSIIADDTFARLNFGPEERIEVTACYHWPMVEGLSNLVRVRRRQDAGVQEVYRKFPELRVNEAKPPQTVSGLARLAATRPLGFAVYLLVHIIVRMQPTVSDWRRGR